MDGLKNFKKLNLRLADINFVFDIRVSTFD